MENLVFSNASNYFIGMIGISGLVASLLKSSCSAAIMSSMHSRYRRQTEERKVEEDRDRPAGHAGVCRPGAVRYCDT